MDRTGLASPVIPLGNPNDLVYFINFYGTKTISLAFVVKEMIRDRNVCSAKCTKERDLSTVNILTGEQRRAFKGM